MKKILTHLCILLTLLAVNSAAQSKVNVQKTSGTNVISGNLVIGDGTSISTTGTGSISGSGVSASVIASDATLGSGGPNATSSITARQIAPGLVFSGVAGATVNVTPGSKWTLAFWAKPETISGNRGILDVSNPYGGICYFKGPDGGKPQIYNGTKYIQSTAVPVAGQESLWVFSTDGTTGTWYKDGIAAGSDTDGGAYAQAIEKIGSEQLTPSYFAGTLRVAIYNRALTAAEVKSLYESGPSGADFNNAGTQLLTSQEQTFTGGVGSWLALNGVASNPSNNLVITGPTSSVYFGAQIDKQLQTGHKYRLELTASVSDGSFTFLVNSTTIGTVTTSPTAFSVEFIEDSTSAGNMVLALLNPDTTQRTITIDSVSLTPLGLVLANDYSVGSGLTVPPLNGTSGTITLPASGVTWSQPNGNLISMGTVAANQATIAGDANGGLTVTPITSFKVKSALNALAAGLQTASIDNDAAGVFWKTLDSPASADARQWAVWNNYNAAGTFEILRSTTSTGAPTALVAKWDKDSNFLTQGNLTASGTGSHVFGTTNTVTLQAGAVTGTEISDPAAPAANSGTFYFRDNGAGKTQFVVVFPTGAVQVIATEP
jgi:hypothetical protein